MGNFCDTLSGLITEANITNAELADKIGVSSVTISNWSNGNHGIELKSLILLCRYFNCSLDYIAGLSETDRKPRSFDIPNFGKHFKELLKEKKVTQYALRNNTKFGSKYLCGWENGVSPKLDTLIELAEYLGCTLDELVGLE